MGWFEAIVLGVVQGLTEFLPISSTAHLRIVPAFAGWDDPGTAFTAVVQLGTMFAVLVYFREDLTRIGRAWLKSVREPELRTQIDAKLGWFMLIGTIPIAIFGLAFKSQIESGARDLYLIGIVMIVLGLVLWAAEIYGTRERKIESLTLKEAIMIGFAQAAALVPGVSRSGATISAGMFLGLEREAAARYSFLLSVPAVVLSGLFELKDIGGGTGASLGATALSTIVAFIVGYAAIAWFLKYLVTHTVKIFVAYRIVVGVLVLLLVSAYEIS
jgi:undecaprenyl-diphosphatase